MDWHWHWHLSRQFRLSLIIGLVLVLLIGVLPYFIPIPPLKKAFQNALIHSTQRTLHAKGAYFVLLPRPAILFKKVALSEANSHATFLRADTLKLDLDILPFFSTDRHIDIEGVTFNRAQFNIIRTEDAHYNFDNLFNAHSHSRLLKLALKAINFQQSGLNFIDKASLHTLRIDDLDLGLNDLRDPKNGLLRLKGKLSFDPEQTWKGNITGSAALHLDRSKRLFQIANLNIKVAQHYAHFSPDDWNAGSFTVQGNLDYGWQPLRLSGGGLILKSRAERADQTWQTHITIPDFTAKNGTLSIEHAMINMNMSQGKTSLSGKAKIPLLFGSQKNFALHTKDAHIEITFKQPSQTLALQFKSALTIDGTQQHIMLPHFQLHGTYHHQSLPRGALTFSQLGQTEINFQKEQLALHSQGSLDKSPMSLNFAMQNFFKPAYTFNWHVDRLDLTPYLPVAIEGAKNLTSSEQIQDFAWLNELKAEGKIRIGQLKLQHTQINDVDVGIKANNNLLTVSPMSASLYDGNTRGTLDINNQGKTPQIHLKQRFNQVNIHPLFKHLFNTTRFDGRGYLDIDLAVAGNTQAQWQQTMGGTMDLKLTKGTFKGLEIFTPLHQTGRQILLLNSAYPALNTTEKKTAKTPFSELSATFFIQKGIVHNKDLDIHTGTLHLTGEGSYDIGNDMLDYRLHTHLPTSPSIRQKQLSKDSTLPIHFTGSLQHPHYETVNSAVKEQTIKDPLHPKASSLNIDHQR